MGMSASQARLLSITARMSDNENSAQGLSYSKQRLADETQQINREYNEALKATKLTVITGFANGAAVYTDISYNLLTDTQMLSGKQYVVTDAKGRAIVTSEIAKAFEKGNGDLNIFLAEMGYSISDLGVVYDKANEDAPEQQAAMQKVHEAWDKYYATLGINLGDIEHDLDGTITFNWIQLTSDGVPTYRRNDGTNYLDKNGNVTTDPKEYVYDPINYEGSTKEQRELYDYATALTRAFFTGNNYTKNGQTITLEDASNANNKDMITYYTNLFNRMATGNYVAYTDQLNDTYNEEYGKHYEYYEDLSKSIMKDNSLFEDKLQKGELFFEYFSSSANDFVSASLGSDQTIVEVEDERAIARAEREYEQALTALESKDKRFDLELNKLDTEHNALQTEYDAVKSVIDKNVEKTFNLFS